MIDIVLGTDIGLVSAAIEGHVVAALFGRALPRLSLFLAVPCLLAAVAIWLGLAFGEADDSAAAGLGIVILGMASILLLCVSVGLVAGSMVNLGVSAGLAVGFALSAAVLWLVPGALYSLTAPVILVASPVIGFLLSFYRDSIGSSAEQNDA